MRKRWKLITVLIAVLLFYYCFPAVLFQDPYATVVTDKKGQLLSAKIAADGQWRFPALDSVPTKFGVTVLQFEDEYFKWHLGVNPISIAKACWNNVQSNSGKRGGSTISMQVIRMARKNQRRTYVEKIIEAYLAFRMECTYSKKEILNLYVSHAPYGGNVVGAEAAAWRYFNRPIEQLSWAEYATLAVLPNAPSLINLGKNQHALLLKRNRLLAKMLNNNVIDSVTYSLSLMEAIPDSPHPLPNEAYHVLDFAIKSGKEGQRICTSIDKNLQKRFSKQLDNYVHLLSENEIRNACAIIVSVETGEVKAYVGNTRLEQSGAQFVDLIQSRRSSGSILKPFLYAKAMEEGMIHPTTLMRDVPISIEKFTPSNFNKEFEGVVPAGEALANSLNVPASLLLRDYGLIPFHTDLQQLGFTTIDRSVSNYGLTLILGGAEVTLWELAKVYTNQAMALKRAQESTYSPNGLTLWTHEKQIETTDKCINSGAWWLISNELTNVSRPDLEQHWRVFSSSRKIAWKTGTSFGFRDAWAVGYDTKYLVAVWVGNAEGDGRNGLTGVTVAAPLMFSAFQYLDKGAWFPKPEMQLKYVNLCATSGLSPTQLCPITEVEMPMGSKMPASCHYHSLILLNEHNERVLRNCAITDKVHDTVWFSLDPVAGYFFKERHQHYRPLPVFAAACQQNTQDMLAIIYPSTRSEIIVPKDFDGKFEQVLLQATHIDKHAQLYWHLNDKFIGVTTTIHKLPVDLAVGNYTLLIMDDRGNKETCTFKVY
jgi:penicillin-binding protein 1C